ncbi:MAG TPA: restriction endonuclease [Planctomycetaceae bacterium]|nr:restriction endonuclease [Planctomycetaceae bacterium]
MSSVLDAVKKVLAKAGEPLHYKEITRRIITDGYWDSNGKTPEATVNAQLSTDIKNLGKESKFTRLRPGVFALNCAPSEESPLANKTELTDEFVSVSRLSFTDAAERILEQFGNAKPMHSRDITMKALDQGMIRTSGRTPAATMYASILEEIRRFKNRGEQPRFYVPGKSMIGLTKSLPVGIPMQVDQHNRKVRAKVYAQLLAMPWGKFEDLVGLLLAKLGFDEIAVTTRKSDKGIDVRGTLVVGDAIRIRMAVQVKRWKDNVQSPTVQQVRGSLGAHEQGLIVTTGDFSPGARKEARRIDTAPVGLMNGQQLVSLMLEHELGVKKTSFDLFEVVHAEIVHAGNQNDCDQNGLLSDK